MAANLERIHQIYMDREQKPVEKVKMMLFHDVHGDTDAANIQEMMNYHYANAGCLVGGVCLQTWNRRLAQVDWRGGRGDGCYELVDCRDGCQDGCHDDCHGHHDGHEDCWD